MLAFAGAITSAFNDNKDTPKDYNSVVFHSTILSTTDRELVFGVLTQPFPSLSQKLSQLTIRRQAATSSPKLHMSVTSLKERLEFYSRIERLITNDPSFTTAVK